jgi:hypothetical protein
MGATSGNPDTGAQGSTDPPAQAPQTGTTVPDVTGTTPGATDWLPDDLRGNEQLKGYQTPAELAKAHLDLQTKITPPATPQEYVLSKLPDGVQVDPQFVATAQTWAHEAGMSKEAFDKFAGRYVEMQIMQQKALADADAADQTSLKKEWGTQYDGNLELAAKAAAKFVDEEFATNLRKNPMSKMAKAFLGIAQKITDDTPPEGGTPADKRPISPATGEVRLKFKSMGDL